MFFAYAFGKPVEVVDVGNGDSQTRSIKITLLSPSWCTSPPCGSTSARSTTLASALTSGSVTAASARPSSPSTSSLPTPTPITRPSPRYGYLAPLYRQGKVIAWDLLKHLTRPLPGTKINEAELRVDLTGDRRIQIFGADNPDALRGLYLDGAVFDEYAQMRPRIWSEVVRPALADREGWATFIGTPHGQEPFLRSVPRRRRRTRPGTRRCTPWTTRTCCQRRSWRQPAPPWRRSSTRKSSSAPSSPP